MLALTPDNRKSQRIDHLVVNIAPMSLDPMVSYNLAFAYLIIYRSQVPKFSCPYLAYDRLAIRIHVHRTRKRAIAQSTDNRPQLGIYRTIVMASNHLFPTFHNRSLMDNQPSATTDAALARAIGIQVIPCALAFIYDHLPNSLQGKVPHLIGYALGFLLHRLIGDKSQLLEILIKRCG